MDAFFTSTSVVALAEMGDKTQLLTLLLATRFNNRFAIISAIFIATLVNHGLSAWFGHALLGWVPANVMQWLVGLSFIAVGLWILIPDKIDNDDNSALLKKGAFIATLLLFSLAELGDKTQVATVLLAARYDELLLVILGTTLGMMLANVPVAYLGQWLVNKIPLSLIRSVCCVIFLSIGVLTLLLS